MAQNPTKIHQFWKLWLATDRNIPINLMFQAVLDLYQTADPTVWYTAKEGPMGSIIRRRSQTPKLHPVSLENIQMSIPTHRADLLLSSPIKYIDSRNYKMPLPLQQFFRKKWYRSTRNNSFHPLRRVDTILFGEIPRTMEDIRFWNIPKEVPRDIIRNISPTVPAKFSGFIWKTKSGDNLGKET